MTRTNIVPQAPTSQAATPTFQAVDNVNGMSFFNSGRGIIYIKASGTCTLTFKIPGGPDGVGFVNGGLQVVFSGAGEKIMSLKSVRTYQQSDGLTYVDATTGTATIAIFEGGI